MSVNIKVWQAGSAVVTDMTNAQKRGKVCQVLRFNGWRPYPSDDPKVKLATRATDDVIYYLNNVDQSISFEEVVAKVEEILAKHGSEHTRVYRDEIKGVHAPVERITAGKEGSWGFSADETGVSVSDYVDQWNQPRSITHNQTPAKAYKLAKAVLAKLEKAETYSEACCILSAAGCRLHSYCAVD